MLSAKPSENHREGLEMTLYLIIAIPLILGVAAVISARVTGP
jgi:hypothetical protein